MHLGYGVPVACQPSTASDERGATSVPLPPLQKGDRGELPVPPSSALCIHPFPPFQKGPTYFPSSYFVTNTAIVPFVSAVLLLRIALLPALSMTAMEL